MFVCYIILIRFEDAIDGFKMIFDGDSSWLLGWMMGYTLICAVSNYSGASTGHKVPSVLNRFLLLAVAVTKELSATTKAVLDQV